MSRLASNPSAHWLLSGLMASSIEVVEKALQNNLDPNIIDPDSGETALQLAIKANDDKMPDCNVVLTKKLIDCGADVNFTNKRFETTIEWLSRQADIANKFEIMARLIQLRASVSTQQLEIFVAICVKNLSLDSLSRDDFGMLAHFASRLCGVDIGKLLNSKDELNSDRYLVHLCEYMEARHHAPGARDEYPRLEGMAELNFLAIRVFSLFETLVKLDKGWLLAADSVRYRTAITREILHELDTIKLIQELNAIYAATKGEGLKPERERLYAIMAETFLERLKQTSLSLASGYRSHVIYINFKYEGGCYKLRFDNLGSGIVKANGQARHPTQDNLIYPLSKKVAADKRLELQQYIISLLEIKYRLIDGYDYRKEQQGSDHYRDKRDRYYKAKEQLLETIYDDANTLLLPDQADHIQGMPRQVAQTCAATSHQVGLLARHDDDFYEWVVAEEKRCIVQPHRNQGAHDAKENRFWQIEGNQISDLQYEDAHCCSFDVDLLLKAVHDSLAIFSRAGGEHAAALTELLQRITPLINYKSSMEKLTELNSYLSAPPRAPNLFVKLIKGAVCMKLANHEANRLKAHILYEEAIDAFALFARIPKPEISEDSVLTTVLFIMTTYHKALAYFFSGNIQQANKVYHECLDMIENYLNYVAQEFNKFELPAHLYQPDSAKMRTILIGFQKQLLSYQHKTHISLGFLYYFIAKSTKESGSLIKAQWYFEQTKESAHQPRHAAAWLGLALIKYQQCCDHVEVRKLECIKQAVEMCKIAKRNTSPEAKAIYHRSHELFETLLKEWQSIISDIPDKQQAADSRGSRKRSLSVSSSDDVTLFSDGKRARTAEPSHLDGSQVKSGFHQQQQN